MAKSTKKNEKVEDVVAHEEVKLDPAIESNPNLKWYILASASGKENSVAKLIKQRARANNLENEIIDAVVPTQEKIAIVRGKKTSIAERVYPGYVFVRMIANENTLQLVRNTEGVQSFLGMTAKPKLPTALDDQQLGFIEVKSEPTYKVLFNIGDAVKVIEGPFKEFIGTIESVSEDKGKARVLLSLFDRDTPVDIDLLMLSKLSQTN